MYSTPEVGVAVQLGVCGFQSIASRIPFRTKYTYMLCSFRLLADRYPPVEVAMNPGEGPSGDVDMPSPTLRNTIDLRPAAQFKQQVTNWQNQGKIHEQRVVGVETPAQFPTGPLKKGIGLRQRPEFGEDPATSVARLL